MKKNEKILKIIFIIALTLVAILLLVFLQLIKPTKKTTVKPTPTPTPIEVVKARTEKTKTYKNYNDTYTNISYLIPIHYKDDNGEWKDIKTTITESERPGFTYEVSTKKVKTYFKETLNEDNYLQLVDGDKIISQGIAKQQENLGEMNFSKAVVSNNIITYPEIYPNIDLRYTIYGAEVLEEFIVKDKETLKKINSFTQNLTLENINLNKENANEYSLGSDIYLPNPLMYELSKYESNQSQEIIYEETQLSFNKYQIKKVITPTGKSWLSYTNRNLPVAIDVTFTESAGSEDARSAQATNSYYSKTENGILTGRTYQDSAWRNLWAGFRFTPNIPRGSTISSATLTLKAQVGGQGPNYVVGAENSDNCLPWGQNDGATITPAGEGPAPGKRTTTDDVAWGNQYFDNDEVQSTPNFSTSLGTVTSRAGWSAGNNLCVLIKWYQFDYPITFYSRENATSSNHPYLSITFSISPPTGLSCTSDQETQVRCTWTNATNITRYKVWRSTTDGGAKTELGTVTSGSIYNDTLAPTPAIVAPSDLTASTDQPNYITVNANVAGTVTNATRYYYVTSQTSDDTVASAYTSAATGYINYGTVASYDVYYNDDGYANPMITGTAIPYNDSTAGAPTLTAPSNLTTSTTAVGGSSCETIRLTIGTAGVSTKGNDRYYKLKTRTSLGYTKYQSSASNAGSRYYGTVSGYNIYDNATSTLLAENQGTTYNDNAAPTPVMVAKITPSAGTYATKIAFNVTAGITPGARAYKAKTYAGAGNLSANFSAASANGNTVGTLSWYTIEVADTSSSTTYGTIYSGATNPYDWTSCSLDIHGWYRSKFSVLGTSAPCQSPYSHTTGGVEAYCTNPTAPKNFLMEGVKFEGVKIAP